MNAPAEGADASFLNLLLLVRIQPGVPFFLASIKRN